jgi:hypothetical protein
MSDPTDVTAPTSPLIAALMARTGGAPAMPANSRYQGLPTRTWTAPDGQAIAYLSRRFAPQASRFAVVLTHTMSPNERLDQVAAAKFGDPLLAWRLADANGALDPAELERRGTRINITLPENMPVNSGA